MSSGGRKGFLGLLVFVLIFAGLIGIYFAFAWYNERYYIRLYDGNVIRYLDIPPFTDRLTPASDELKGKCTLYVGTSYEQAGSFFSAMSRRYGYVCVISDHSLSIDVKKDYKILGEYKDNKLFLHWTPVLPENLKSKLQK